MTSTDLAVPHPDAPLPGTVLPVHSAGCFGCDDVEGGLRLLTTIGDGLSLTATFVVEDHHQGAPGIAHGGLIATAFDEALGALQVLFRERAVTASLQTDYRLPIPVGTLLHLACRVDRREGRKLWTSGDAHVDGPAGPIVAQATALFVVVSHEQFTTHGSPR
jgi:acyl-coenzyme A thioesterase PaaI-like protein